AAALVGPRGVVQAASIATAAAAAQAARDANPNDRRGSLEWNARGRREESVGFVTDMTDIIGIDFSVARDRRIARGTAP
ncbi:hypothetical protein, partial [Burkholderia thailandensis]|uniref:hypothetical protein n=2 Tax=Burkholderia thailandensis TaxID=57975 RepID=UPI00057265F8